ncbi:MAG: GAF domain-containing sensor histidine kinase [Chloroflexi bacterium]|nr:GAF domain-containing sensor histidine kinase [Chloroflexota bacterium]
MPSYSTLLSGGLALAYTLILVLLLRRDQDQAGHRIQRWLVFTLVAALVAAAIYLLPDDAHAQSQYEALFVGDLTQPALGIITINLLLVLFGTHLLRYLQFRFAPVLLVVGLVWWAVQAVSSLTTSDLIIGEDGWLGRIYDPVVVPGLLTVVGWAVLGGLLLLAAFWAFARAHLPEVANQALFGAMLVPLVLLSAVLSTTGTDYLAEMGWLLLFVGLLGTVYSASVYRVFDIRRTLRHATATLVLTIITALVLFAAFLGAQGLDTDSTVAYIVLGVLALMLAALYIPLRTGAQLLVNRVFGATAEETSQMLRQFSEDITGVVELDALVEVTMRTLRQMLRVRRGGLVLVTEEGADSLHIEPVPQGLGEIPDIAGRIVRGGPIFKRLVNKRAPLLQYDLDFARDYESASPDERGFFKALRMSAYAPVMVQGQLVGLLCCGAKSSDDPFTDSDLELMMTIANQAGVALRNARLVADLRRREMEQAELNRALSGTKEVLERLDEVKTDFITIASHELRTPLAQIRGYTDIMEAMNEQGMLDQEQIEGMTGNLRKAADRLENLIGAMLDVSQLDVDAMDLRFAQTSIENVMRMAIEPLTESVRNRKLMLSARGLRDLPPLQGDMQRLVQAFRNVVLNAIKFTPDGGRIDITGQMQDDDILVTIKDSGIGIDPANHELIFEKFFRAHDPSLHSTGATKFMGAGPGLGLTIAKGVIDGHGGRIWVESEGHDPETLPGCTFYIALPLNPPAEAKRVLPFESSTAVRQTQELPAAGSNGEGDVPEAAQTILRPPAGLRDKAE